MLSIHTVFSVFLHLCPSHVCRDLIDHGQQKKNVFSGGKPPPQRVGIKDNLLRGFSTLCVMRIGTRSGAGLCNWFFAPFFSKLEVP